MAWDSDIFFFLPSNSDAASNLRSTGRFRLVKLFKSAHRTTLPVFCQHHNFESEKSKRTKRFQRLAPFTYVNRRFLKTLHVKFKCRTNLSATDIYNRRCRLANRSDREILKHKHFQTFHRSTHSYTDKTDFRNTMVKNKHTFFQNLNESDPFLCVLGQYHLSVGTKKILARDSVACLGGSGSS